MTNRQWLIEQMQNMSDEELADLIHIPLKMEEEVCDFKGDCFSEACIDCKTNWLKLEHKEPITLSDAERVILENIDKEYKWIARDDDSGNLCVYIEKPTRIGEEKFWSVKMNAEYRKICFYDHLFRFITGSDTEPYNIEELLKVN